MDIHNFDVAKTVLALAINKAKQDYQRAICVALCDASGLLLAFVRAGDAPLRSISLAQQKAYTASRMGVSTTAFLARLHRDALDIGYFCDLGFTALPGGNVLRDADGVLLGGVGISGLAPEEDQLVADMIADLVRTPQDNLPG